MIRCALARRSGPGRRRRALALMLLVGLPSGCRVPLSGHWRMVAAVPNKEVFSIDDATFGRDGSFTATTTLEGKTTRDAGTYSFNGFKLILRPHSGGRREYNAVLKMGKLEILAGRRKVVLKKDK